MGKTDYAYEYIKGKIISGEYPPLSDISEDKLQKELEVSRTPVREGILRLEKEDLVHVYPRKGTIVSAITLDLIEDVYGVRELIEPAMVLSSMHQLDREWLTGVRKKILNPPKDLEGEKLRRYLIDQDTELHAKITMGCPNRYLIRLMNTIIDQNLRLRIISSHPTEGEGSVEEHVALIDALLDNNRRQVEDLLKEHLEHSKVRTIQHFRYREPVKWNA